MTSEAMERWNDSDQYKRAEDRQTEIIRMEQTRMREKELRVEETTSTATTTENGDGGDDG